jgi:hypothetical protein
MFILRCAVLLAAALTLSNCCLSSSGCSSGPVALTAAPAPGAPGSVAAAPAWDGLNDQSAADDDATVDVTPPKKASRRSKAASVDAMSSRSTTASRGKVDWAEEQAVNQAEDARLKQKLIICKNCSASQ